MERAEVVATLRSAGCVFADEEADLLARAARDPEDLRARVASRAAGVPLEQVVGWARFDGLRMVLEPGVFVPRRRTERLVAEAARHLGTARGGAPERRLELVDLCCGSGAIGAAIAHRVPTLRVHAVDLEPAAVRCASTNLAVHAGTGHVALTGDLDAPLPSSLRGHVDLIAANVPYVPSSEIPLLPREAREHERIEALDGGADGLALLRRVVAAAPSWLRPGGVVLSEIAVGQADRAIRLAEDAGLEASVREPEDGTTVLVGLRRA